MRSCLNDYVKRNRISKHPLRDNPNGILILRDELVGLLASWEREGREGDRAFFWKDGIVILVLIPIEFYVVILT